MRLRMQAAGAVPGVSSQLLPLSISKGLAKDKQVCFLFVHSLYFAPHYGIFFYRPSNSRARRICPDLRQGLAYSSLCR